MAKLQHAMIIRPNESYELDVIQKKKKHIDLDGTVTNRKMNINVVQFEGVMHFRMVHTEPDDTETINPIGMKHYFPVKKERIKAKRWILGNIAFVKKKGNINKKDLNALLVAKPINPSYASNTFCLSCMTAIKPCV